MPQDILSSIWEYLRFHRAPGRSDKACAPHRGVLQNYSSST